VGEEEDNVSPAVITAICTGIVAIITAATALIHALQARNAAATAMVHALHAVSMVRVSSAGREVVTDSDKRNSSE
jgi:hypothetical protein